MKIETIRKNHKKEIIISIVAFLIIAIVLIVGKSLAKYEIAKSIKIAEGTINYKIPDFKIMAMYKQKDNETCTEDNCYNEMSETDRMPSSGYVINESKSYCTLDNINKDTSVRLYTNAGGEHIIKNMAKSEKCYLYFDKESASLATLNRLELTVTSGTPDFNKTSCATGTNNGGNCGENTIGLYKTQDDDGDTYYFRGSVENNYVKFTNKWWRIIRINGDGSIRLIYDGTSAHANGEKTADSIAVASQTFNANRDDNMYVGFKYTSGQVHGLGTKSNALTQLETWYQNNLASYASKIDTNAGFCGDRTPSTSSTEINNQGGTGTTYTIYGAYIRLYTNKIPTLTCANASDLYTVSSSIKGNKSLTYPIGLITGDEVSMAGGAWGNNNYGYYLYNGQKYWTMSPSYYDSYYDGIPCVFYMHSNGYLYNDGVHSMYNGLRPVINLKANTTFTFTGAGIKGTMTNPYIVS